jgi:hypothetical protein
MDGRTSSSSPAPRRNPRAGWSVVCGLLSLVAVPAGIVLAKETRPVTLVNSSGSVAVALLLGFCAIVLARRARERVEITLGRAGGRGAARLGRVLGLLGLLVGTTAALALGFYGLLTLFAG